MPINQEAIEQILRNPYEDRTVEFKGPGTWDEFKYKLTLASLAMANLTSYGYVIVGVSEKDGRPFLQGLGASQVNNFNPDEVQDFITKHLDPPVEINCGVIVFEEKQFFAIQVGYQGFRPVKARKGTPDQAADHIANGHIYYRPKGVKPQSRKATPEDLEDLVMDLVDSQLQDFGRKMMLAFPDIGKGIKTVDEPNPVDEDKFAKQRGDFQ